jgi:hypothetical protein
MEPEQEETDNEVHVTARRATSGSIHRRRRRCAPLPLSPLPSPPLPARRPPLPACPHAPLPAAQLARVYDGLMALLSAEWASIRGLNLGELHQLANMWHVRAASQVPHG